MATYDLTQGIPSKIVKNDILNCPYSGHVIEITLKKGVFDLSLYGGQGGSYSSNIGGYGGVATGRLVLKEQTTLYLYTGGAGSSSGNAGGFNGGGNGVNSYGRGGGGASDIRLRTDSLYSRVIVASGGGGAGPSTGSANPAGCGGGEYGGDGYYNNFTGQYIVGTNRNGGGATYNQGGISWNSVASTRGQFGVGGNASNYSCGGGGSGWYGGGGAYDNDSDSDGRSGGGGSGYIYTEALKSRYPEGCTLTDDDLLTNATYSNSTHTGNGNITITVIDYQSYEGHKLDEPEPDYHITDDLTLTPPTYDGYNIIRNNLVFNRTNTDVITAKNITNKVKTYQRLSDQEQYMFDYKLKGAYNYTDLNRVESWCKLMKDLLFKMSYGVDTTTFKTDWNSEDYISLEELDRIKNNVKAIREAFNVYASTPESSRMNIGKNKINIDEANSMEKIIDDVYQRLFETRQMYRKCGVFKLGQNFLWQQRFRREKNWASTGNTKFSEFGNEKLKDIYNNNVDIDILKVSEFTPVESTVRFINNYMKDIDGFTGYIYGGGDNPKYYWFNGDYKSLLQKTLQGGGRDVQPPIYEGETPTLEDVDYALICYYDDDDEELDRVIQKKQFTFDSFVPFEADPLVPKELDDVEGTIKVADFDVSLSSGMTDVVPTKQGYTFDGWQKVIIDDVPSDYNFKPKWR